MTQTFVWFSWILRQINHCRLFNAKSSLFIYIKYIWFGCIYIKCIWFGLVLWHINHCRLLNAKSSLFIYIKYIWFGWVLWHINHCRLFNSKSPFYIYIKYIWFGLVWFYGMSIIVGYLMLNPLYSYISNKYDFVWLGLSVKQFYLIRRPNQVLTHRVNLSVMAMKGYSTFLKAPVLLVAHHQIVSCHNKAFVGGSLPLRKEEVGVFYSSSRMGYKHLSIKSTAT